MEELVHLPWMPADGGVSAPLLEPHTMNYSNALGLFTRRLCTEVMDFNNPQAYVACRPVLLNKRPEVCPIGICEVAR